MSITVERFINGPLETNSYLVADSSGDALIVDPSGDVAALLTAITEKKLIPRAVVLTHGHFDHFLGLSDCVARFPTLPVYIHPGEEGMLRDPEMNGSMLIGLQLRYQGEVADLVEGDYQFGTIRLTVLLVPGHSPAGVAILVDTVLLSGDILFANSIGRSDLPGGDGELLIAGIKQRLFTLPDETIVCPGHGGRTTIGREKRMNPYL